MAELVPAFTNLLKDNEAEVRAAAAAKVKGLSIAFDKQILVSQLGPLPIISFND